MQEMQNENAEVKLSNKRGIEKLFSKCDCLILIILYLVCAIIHSLTDSLARLFLGWFLGRRRSVYLLSYIYLFILFICHCQICFRFLKAIQTRIRSYTIDLIILS